MARIGSAVYKRLVEWMPDAFVAVWRDIKAWVRPLLDRLRTLLYAIGLGILILVKGEEPAKTLIRRSRSIALAQCVVHIVPACVSVGIIATNLSGYFIGSELQGIENQDSLKFGLLQVAAKLQVGTTIFLAGAPLTRYPCRSSSSLVAWQLSSSMFCAGS